MQSNSFSTQAITRGVGLPVATAPRVGKRTVSVVFPRGQTSRGIRAEHGASELHALTRTSIRASVWENATWVVLAVAAVAVLVLGLTLRG
jgi:hypothetical protein